MWLKPEGMTPPKNSPSDSRLKACQKQLDKYPEIETSDDEYCPHCGYMRVKLEDTYVCTKCLR